MEAFSLQRAAGAGVDLQRATNQQSHPRALPAPRASRQSVRRSRANGQVRQATAVCRDHAASARVRCLSLLHTTIITGCTHTHGRQHGWMAQQWEVLSPSTRWRCCRAGKQDPGCPRGQGRCAGGGRPGCLHHRGLCDCLFGQPYGRSAGPSDQAGPHRGRHGDHPPGARCLRRECGEAGLHSAAFSCWWLVGWNT